MKHMVSREELRKVNDAKSTIEQLGEQIQKALEPPIKDMSLLSEVSSFLETVIEEENRFLRKKIKIAVLLFLFAPDSFLFPNEKRCRDGVMNAISKEAGLSKARFWQIRKRLIERYMRYGKFSELVDRAYENVAECYKSKKMFNFSTFNER